MAAQASGAAPASAPTRDRSARIFPPDEKWPGEQWHGEQWHGEQWHGEQWHGEQWHGEQWHGEQWHGEQWHGEQWHGEPRDLRRGFDVTRARDGLKFARARGRRDDAQRSARYE